MNRVVHVARVRHRNVHVLNGHFCYIVVGCTAAPQPSNHAKDIPTKVTPTYKPEKS